MGWTGMTLTDRIRRGATAIAKAKADVSAWETHLESLRRQLADAAADPTEGRIIAVEICSNVLEAHIWLAFDDSFDPRDGQAVFYADELPILATKTPEQLRAIHNTKVAFGPRSMVRQ